ncbi:MAG: hypothetical protein GY765_29640 [bacterium]|nr:hypothetical protein [bacterium]
MKLLLKSLTLICAVLFISLFSGCGPEKVQPTTEPPSQPVPQEPTIEELRKPVAKDPGMFKAVTVLKKYGTKSKTYMSYEKYQKMSASGAMDPSWFYDQYDMNMNEKKHWIKVILGTSERAVQKDPRIAKIMAELPQLSISMEVKTPSGKIYLLSDMQGDGILDYAADSKKKSGGKVDIPLLDKMQEKYTWIIGIVKKHYKK